MDLGLRDRVYIVTGASRGLGRAAAQVLAEEGARLVVSSRDPDRVAGAVAAMGEAAVGVAADNADDQWRAAFESVFLGALRVARKVAGACERGGSVAFVLSSSVRSPIPGLAVSNGLRPGLAMAAKTLADELGPSGIRVNGVMPGRVATDRVAELDAAGGDPVATRRSHERAIPLRRYGEPEEFGRVAAFLLSPAASYVTGAMVPVDGGLLRTI